MEGTVLSKKEITEYEEFKRERREREVTFTLKRLEIDAARRETDRYALNAACDLVKKTGAAAIAVFPVNVSAARRRMGEGEPIVSCVAGGTGESLISVKKAEAKRAARQGAKEIRLVPCYSALFGGNFAYLKREIRRVKRSVKKCVLVYSLDDRSLSEAEIERGVRAACEAKADAVSVRGEIDLIMLAVRLSAGRVRVDASGVENAEQLRLLVKAGAARGMTRFAAEIEKELYCAAEEGGFVEVIPITETESGDTADRGTENEN